jgi:hypothetical protein
MKALKIKIKTTDGIDHTVEAVDSTDFLAVHPHFDDRRFHVVTHIPTGRQVAISNTPAGATAIMKRLSQVGIDWDFTSLNSRQHRNAGAICEFVLGGAGR